MKFNFFPIAVWWQDYRNIEYWVTQRGVNVLMWDRLVCSEAGDWEKAHQIIESLRKRGYNVWAIRQPAYLLGTDKLDINFDLKWKSHLLAFDLDDEFEDKQHGTLWANTQAIIDYVAQRIADYNKWLPGIPVFANFNGTHIGPDLQAVYTSIVNLGIDIVCSDNYPVCNQMKRADGSLYYPDVVAAVVNGTKLFKQWFPTKSVWTFFETCNQDLHKPGDPGWADGLTFVGSRAMTSNEIWQSLYYVKQYGGDGIAYFPQSHGGAIDDATDPGLIPTLAQIGASLNPSAVKPPTPPLPPVPPAPPKLTGTIVIHAYSDGSTDVCKTGAK